jgi:hypothetical protein
MQRKTRSSNHRAECPAFPRRRQSSVRSRDFSAASDIVCVEAVVAIYGCSVGGGDYTRT